MNTGSFLERASTIFLASTLVLATGCATLGQMDEPMERPTTMFVRVHNDIEPPQSITVYIHPQQGSRDLLGVVEPDTTATFEYQREGVNAVYQLSAETTEGGHVVSHDFNMTRLHGADWSLWENRVTLYRATRVEQGQVDTTGADTASTGSDGTLR